MFARGVRGFYGLAKHLKNLDLENRGTLDHKTFYKGLQDFRLDLPESDAPKVYELLDVVKNGNILYDDFLKKTAGELNDFRKNLLVHAFQRLDPQNQGFTTIDDINSKRIRHYLFL